MCQIPVLRSSNYFHKCDKERRRASVFFSEFVGDMVISKAVLGMACGLCGRFTLHMTMRLLISLLNKTLSLD